MIKKIYVNACFLVGLFLSLSANELAAQPFSGAKDGTTPAVPRDNSGTPSYYIVGSEGVQIDVNVWGQVLIPGRYVVNYQTDLVSLLSFAGGPTQIAKLDEVKIIRYVRQDTTVIEKLVRVDLDRFVEFGEQSNIPPLQRGDTVVIPANAISVLQVTTSVLGNIVAIINTALLVVTLASR